MVTISGMVCIYYNVIIMYSIYYMFVSFVNLDGEVPWVDCDNPWNTKACRQEAYPDFKSMTNETQKVYELYSKCFVWTWVKLNTNFQRKSVNIFLTIIFSICFGCSKEPSH